MTKQLCVLTQKWTQGVALFKYAVSKDFSECNCVVFIFTQGQCFVAIDPNAFEDGFAERMSELMSYCRNLEPVCKQSIHSFVKKLQGVVYTLLKVHYCRY